MSNNKVALQANFKTTTGALLNVYGETPEEFEFNLKCFVSLVADINAAERALSAPAQSASDPIAVIQNSFPGATVVSETTRVQEAPAQASHGSAPACRHGQMSWVAPANKPWKGWFCPQPKEATDKCSPQFIKG
jgi:hypothetical protein